MKVDPGIFKAYDIRGIYGQNLFDDTAKAVGKAFVKIINSPWIIVGHDARVSSPSLSKSLIEGINSCGVNVLYLGFVSTDMYYFACATKKLPGIMVTASHNPKEYNGFKMVKQIPYLLSGDEGINEIKNIIEKDEYPEESQNKGILEEWKVMDDFVNKILSLVDTASFPKMKIICDTANGMVGPILDSLFSKIPQVSLTRMYFEPDGNFPNHGGDPLQEENRAELQKRVVEEGADLGFAFDPDGDRFFCIDKKGRFVSGDFMTAILAEYFLTKFPKSTIIYDIRASYCIPDKVAAMGGRALYNRVGHAFIKKRMVDEDGIFGGEVTGHYYFKDFYFCDSGVAPLMYLLDLLSKSSKSLDQMIDELSSKYFISGEINTKDVVAESIFQKLKEKYESSAREIIDIDGISYIFDDWHFNVRSSNTEPLLRLNLEAFSKEKMESKRDEVLAIIRSK